MATPSKIQLDPSLHPVFFTALTKESADKASELLQENHEKHHIFFNSAGFHNHIVHHLLSLYAIGATPAQLQKGYNHNKGYQLPPVIRSEKVFERFHDPAVWKKYLGDGKYYNDYLIFFKTEMESYGWEHVINQYLFSRTEQADDMLVRLFTGILHPLLHLGFGMEFRQPAIIAEALAQTAAHGRWGADFLLKAEEMASKSEGSSSEKSLPELLEEIRANKNVNQLASQFTVQEDDLERRMTEMMNAAIYFTAAAQRPNSRVKMDFYFMHSVNASIFFPAFLSSSSPLSTDSKIRLLEWKTRMDLSIHASHGAPALLLSEVINYRPRKPSGWQEVFERVKNYGDDGHATKMLRTVAAGEEICRKWEARPGVDMKVQGDMWLQIGHMVIDSVERDGDSAWGRGFL